ncbi:hypothetical protein COCCADRAFT_82135 [Bipolaris zeicola 26-R-13]|uniref:Uncharacterized protein n=1 Tax=Cochliobolus carbonum (strain 26-R-13) TaxID=930089 RepID=W6YHU5_COCC2|nr:uncharacterized protein COCCADRAFT_82135 [Bipolaris zeicola 26-R-13]EUC38882.1 hypothetical protein COCCADRAFT_82135 [Bipolaris zeicola 26-R-13]
MGLEGCESNDLAWRSGLSPWFHGLGKESAGQRVGSRFNAYHTAASHGLRRSAGWTMLGETSQADRWACGSDGTVGSCQRRELHVSVILGRPVTGRGCPAGQVARNGCPGLLRYFSRTSRRLMSRYQKGAEPPRAVCSAAQPDLISSGPWLPL